MRWFETPNFDFVSKRKIAYVISGILLAISIGAILTKGLQYGIDFKGGKEIVLKFESAVDVTEIRSSLTTPLGSTPEVKLFGSESEVLIRTDNTNTIEEIETIVRSTMSQLYPDNDAITEKTDSVGPRIAEDLKSGGLQAVIYSMIIIFVYILARFRKWTFSAGAVAALFHDVTITLGIFTLLSDVVNFSLLIDQNIIAAFLTIVGYSLNDTVVVFDRIRENSIVHKGMEFIPMVNKSLNDTLSRTIITSVTTLFVVAVLFIFGGEVLKGFSFALLIGIVLGTYSSLFVASSLVVELNSKTNK
ncbi:MAG TPA: protein translocase subunit SecF [Balneola sp.]|jgi:preprotein translocase SecF subunit|nr:protein translocase subunit SecF [Bacteroidota bacterium]MAC06006.1 protein translocase subunit SecF [Balneola sp.]MAO77805.1 protein translocase subunit SecF [Balneola sp.]MBF63259.1 protein translocase subunit SecF [Balneola sp.]HAH52589.1 protein translocase subunit SecF [Balneola sp.]|tara:strand:+ start:111 stop:1019 length:909 start_codon:yes stop_codon:yes gene_type:complete